MYSVNRIKFWFLESMENTPTKGLEHEHWENWKQYFLLHLFVIYIVSVFVLFS